MSDYFNKLIVLEIANNHFGDAELAKEIITKAKEQCEQFKDTFQFGIKLQYRDLDTFIHPNYKGNKGIKFVKRFEETRLTWDEFKDIKDYIKECGFISICTPFDENSVDKIIEHDYDIIKIASCSFTDWTLLEKIAETNKPIIASTGAASLDDIDLFVEFMRNRKKELALLHCIPEYPTKRENSQLNQLNFLRDRYKNLIVGFSSHFDFPIFLASCEIFEFHVKLGAGNNYSVDINFLCQFLQKAIFTLKCGGVKNKRYEIPQKQKDTIRSLQRGVFAKEDLKAGDILTKDNTFLAMPIQEGQMSASDFSKYKEFRLNEVTTRLSDGITYNNILSKNHPVFLNEVIINETRKEVLDIIKKIVPIIKASSVAIPDGCEMELSHHYGLSSFEKHGAVIFNLINRDYCKKIIIVLPNQLHPTHYHIKKDETFHVLYGDLLTEINNVKMTTHSTEDNLISVEIGQTHSFLSINGCVFEEISTTHFKDDSFYFDEKIMNNPNRKTKMTYRKSWLEG